MPGRSRGRWPDPGVIWTRKTAPDPRSAASATVYGENRTVPISGNTITDSFGPYAVHIYRVP